VDEEYIDKPGEHGHAYASEQDAPEYGPWPLIHQQHEVDGKQARVDRRGESQSKDPEFIVRSLGPGSGA
jgi:hypothetical protein